jgi:SET domain-containing protein
MEKTKAQKIKSRHASKGVEVKRSKLGGLGLFATRDFKKGEFIIEYIGEKLTTAEADRRGGKYLFILNKHFTLDGKSRKNVARYANHACRPSAESDVKRMRVVVTALRPIHTGEEIVYDYGKEYFDEFIKPKGCQCGFCDGKGKKIPLRILKKNRSKKS